MNIFSTWAGSVWNAEFDQRKALLLPNENLRGGLAFKASHCWHNWQLPGPIRSREQFHAGIQVGLWNPPCSRCRYFEIIEIQKGPTDDSITVKRNEDKQLGKSMMGKPNLHAGAPSKEWIEVKSSLLPVGLWASVNRRVKRVEKPSVSWYICATLTPKGSLPVPRSSSLCWFCCKQHVWPLRLNIADLIGGFLAASRKQTFRQIRGAAVDFKSYTLSISLSIPFLPTSNTSTIVSSSRCNRSWHKT